MHLSPTSKLGYLSFKLKWAASGWLKVSMSTSHAKCHWFAPPSVLPKHTLFKVLYFILAKLKNYTKSLFILYFSQIL